MPSHRKEIRKTLETALASISGIPDIIFENSTKDPTKGVPHVISQVMFTGREPAVRGTNPQQRYDGILRLELKVPEGKGTAQADTLVDLILDAMDATTDFIGTNIVVRTDESYANDGVTVGGWYSVPISVIWYAYKT